MKHLSEQGILKANEQGGTLTLLFDNCANQNNNNFILKLGNYIFERRFSKMSTPCFGCVVIQKMHVIFVEFTQITILKEKRLHFPTVGRDTV